ncbi:MAG TPA: carboxymuconolactone decarboxylase family protein [Methanobacterium sp.]|nr:carboxymuconolactone decarboxylase family protein [Methanobacterium sp.]
MKQEVFYSKGMKHIKEDYPDIYDVDVKLNEVAYSGKVLDYKTQKLIALGITAAKSDDRATKKQIKSNMEEFGATRDEIMDVLRVVMLIAGKPAFMKAVNILYSIKE